MPNRVGPPGVSSGVSHRALPKSCVAQVRDICMHYVSKCSGKYSSNVAAARYVHQMADEVIQQLAGVAADIERRNNEPEVLQKLLDEWHASFPASLGQIGSPRAIAAKLEQQDRQIQDLTEQLKNERAEHSRDVSSVMRSMDAQLLASRSGVMIERKQLSAIHHKEIVSLQQEMEELKQERERSFSDLNMRHDSELQEQKRRYGQDI